MVNEDDDGDHDPDVGRIKNLIALSHLHSRFHKQDEVGNNANIGIRGFTT